MAKNIRAPNYGTSIMVPLCGHSIKVPPCVVPHTSIIIRHLFDYLNFVETAIFDRIGNTTNCNADNLREAQFFC